MTSFLPRVVHVAAGREWRGGERQVLLLARGLAHAGVEQLVVTARGGRLAAELARAGIPHRAVGWSASFSPGALLAVRRAAREAPALLHAHDAHALILAGLVARLRRVPLVATRRVTFPLRRPGFWARSDRVIAISGAVRQALLASGIDAGRISVVHSAVDLDAARATAPDPLRSRLGIPDAAPVAVSVAAFTAEKDHATLVDAALAVHDRRADLHWVLAGDGPLRPALTERIGNAGAGSFIHLVGWVDEPRRLIAAGSVFVSTSTEEGLGTSILDALALGIPVVATRTGGIPELLDGGAGILAPPRDVQAVARGVDLLLEDAVLRAWTVERGRESAARFGVAGMVEAVRSVYRSVVLAR